MTESEARQHGRRSWRRASVASGQKARTCVVLLALAAFFMVAAPVCRKNKPPFTPSPPEGPPYGDLNIPCAFTASTTDPDGDSVRYQFDWGDGTRDWTGFLPGGANGQAPHTWSSSGSYSVRVMAQDTHGDSSDWSVARLVRVDAYPDRVVATIHVGSMLDGIAALPDGEYVYVTSNDSACVYAIRTSDNAVVDTIPVGRTPSGIAALPNGQYVYVACTVVGCVYVIRTSDNAVVATIPTDWGATSVAASPDGSYVYVSNTDSGNVSVIRTSDNVVVATIPIDIVSYPKYLAVLPTGDFVLVTDDISYGVWVIRAADNKVVDWVGVGSLPAAMVALPDSRHVIVSSEYKRLSVIQVPEDTVVATITLDARPTGMAVLPGGDYVYAAHPDDDQVSILRMADKAVVATLPVGATPCEVTAIPNGEHVYVVSWDGVVSVIGY